MTLNTISQSSKDEVKTIRRTVAPLLLFAAVAIAFAAGDVVVIKGGARI